MKALSDSGANKNDGAHLQPEKGERRRDGIGIVEVRSVATTARKSTSKPQNQTEHRLVNMNDMTEQADGRVECIKSAHIDGAQLPAVHVRARDGIGIVEVESVATMARKTTSKPHAKHSIGW